MVEVAEIPIRKKTKGVRIKFHRTKDADFVTELRRRVDLYFETNKLSTYANSTMVIKTITLLLVAYVPYFFIMIATPPIWVMAIGCVIMGLGFAGVGFSIGHDALHGAYSSRHYVNRWLGYSFNLVGASDYMWKIKHNQKHHTYTNIYDHDDDLECRTDALGLPFPL